MRLAYVLMLTAVSSLTFGRAAGAQSTSSGDSLRVQDSVTTRRRPFTIGLALGPGISIRRFSEGISGTQVSFALAGGLFRGSRFGSSRAGFLPAFKLSIRPTRIDVVNDSSSSAPVLQTLKLQPQMLGIGWSAPITGQLTIKFSAVAGRSFNGLSTDGGSKRDARLQLFAPASSVDDDFVWETTSRLWHQITQKASFVAGVSYVHSRPELHLVDGSMRPWNADQVHFDAGVAFTLFQFQPR